MSHQTNKFILSSDSMYLRATQGAGFCYPVFPTSLVEPSKLIALKAEKRTATEWTSYFEGLSNLKEIELEKDSDDDPSKDIERATKVGLDKTPAKPTRYGELIQLWNEDTTPTFFAPAFMKESWTSQANEWERVGIPSVLIAHLLNYFKSNLKIWQRHGLVRFAMLKPSLCLCNPIQA